MRINVDVLANLIGVKSGEIIWAVKNDNTLNGVKLPDSQRGIKNINKNGPKSLTFEVVEAMKFAEKYKAQKK